MAEINPSAYDELRWKPADFVGVIKGADAPLLLRRAAMARHEAPTGGRAGQGPHMNHGDHGFRNAEQSLRSTHGLAA